MIGASVSTVNKHDAPRAATAEGDREAATHGAPAVLPPDLQVLVAGAASDDRALLRQRLERLGGHVREVSSVLEAASSARRHPPSVLVVTDRLSDGTAVDLLMRLTVARGMVLCPTVVVMGSDSVRRAVQMLRLGAGDCLSRRHVAEDPARGSQALELSLIRAREQHRLSKRAALYRANTLIKRRRERVALDEAESAHREAERARERLGLAVEGADLGTWDWNPATGRVVHNDRLVTMLGYAPGELKFTYSTWRQLLHPEDAPRAAEALGQHLEGRTERYRTEYRLRTRSGQWRWLLVSGHVVARDDLGRPTRVAGVHIDIDDRKRAELGLLEAKNHAESAQQRLVDMVTSIRDAFLLLDKQWRFTFVNPMGERLLGKAVTELVGRVIWDVWPGLDDTDFAPALRKAMHEREMGEVTAEWLQGGRWVELRAYPAEEGGISLFLIDVTQQKQFEQQLRQAKETAEAARVSAERAKETAEQANRAKSEFLAVLSHELRTPLTPVLAGVQLLQEELAEAESQAAGAGDDERMQTLGMIRRNVELEVRLIDDLLDLTRVTRGKMQLSCKRVDLNSSVRHVVDICRSELEEKALTLSLKLSEEPMGVLADPARLQQVLWNVVKNAIKFTPEGGEITMRTFIAPAEPGETAGDAGGMAVCEVQDTGVGIEPNLLPGIFNAFEQGGERVTRTFGGLGLGLAITRALVVAHGGRITARSAGRGKGATFAVRLPGVALTDIPAQSPPQARGPSADGACVLLVEDHADTAHLMRRFLERRLRVKVLTAGSVREGVDVFRRESRNRGVDLIISDIGLPDGTGRELLERILGQDPGSSIPPAIALSGYGTEQDIRRSRDAGFREHITKPVDLDRLEQSVRQVLR